MKFDDMLMLCVRKDIDAGKIPMLLGEPGIGKSSWLENLATLMRTSCFTVACNQLADKADLTGARLVPTEDKMGYKQMFYPHAVICDAITYAEENPRETPILFLDELNRTTPDVTSELLSIPTMRAIGSIHLPKNLRVVIAGNDKGNITSLDEASVSRFVLYRVEPDTPTFLGLDAELNPFVRSVLEANPDTIFCKTLVDGAKDDDTDDQYIDDIMLDDDGMSQFTTPRTISGVSDWLNQFTNDELKLMIATPASATPDSPSVLQEAIEGHVGHTRFSVLLMNQILSDISRVDNQANSLIIERPKFFDKFDSITSMSALEDFIENDLTDSDRSAALVYALADKHDNTKLLRALAPCVAKLEPTDVKTLTRLVGEERLDDANVNAFLDTNTTISNSLSFILIV